MKITIVEAGLPPAAIRADWPGYPEMFAELIGAASDGFTFETVSIVGGAPLPDPAGLDAVLITGSRSGVYDPEPWMPPLFEFIRAAAAARTPQVGVCFGHQAIAKALGGRVEKSEKGWGVGRHVYRVAHRPGWLEHLADDLSLIVSHQDQVLEPPAGARTVAASEFTPHGVLHYDTAPIISLQPHPEFSPGFAAALYESRRDAIAADRLTAARASLEEPLDAGAAAASIVKFLRSASRN